MPPSLLDADPAIRLKRRLTVRYACALGALVVLLVATFFIGRAQIAAARFEVDQMAALVGDHVRANQIGRIAGRIGDGVVLDDDRRDLRRMADQHESGRSAVSSSDDALGIETDALVTAARRLADEPDAVSARALKGHAAALAARQKAAMDADRQEASDQLDRFTQMTGLLLVAWLVVIGVEVVFVFLPGLHLLARHIDDYTRARRLERQLRSVRRMRVLGRMAGGMAHEFNNILMPIVGLSDLLRERMAPGSDDRRLIDLLVEAGDRAKRLVARVRVLDRPLEVRGVDLGAVIEHAIAACASLPGVERIHIELPAASRGLRADAGALAQAIIEVLRNALGAIGPAGRVVIEVGREEVGNPESSIFIRVVDDGHGMSPTVREAAFDPFFTTRSVGDGVGLGLSVAHGIVSAHGGRIEIESVEGRGAVVTMYIPADLSTTGDEA